MKFPLWRSRNESDLRFQVQSLAFLSRLRIWHCCELWCSSQMRLGSGMAVAGWAVALIALLASLGTSICCRCGPKKQKNKTKKTYLLSNNLTSGNLYFGNGYVQRYRDKAIHRSIVCVGKFICQGNDQQLGIDDKHFVIAFIFMTFVSKIFWRLLPIDDSK